MDPTPKTLESPTVEVAGLVLAGGLARRMGGQDKGLVELAGRPMIEHVLATLAPQVTTVLINANRNLEHYSRYGYPIVPDHLEGFQGPLAGVLSGLRASSGRLLLTVPCDAPLLASDLALRLRQALLDTGADLAVASDGERLQPVFMMLEKRLEPSLEAFLESGGRKIDAWFAGLRLATVDFSDRPECFANVNDPTERSRLENVLLSRAEGSR